MAIAAETTVRWETTFEAAREMARRDGKPILVDFTAAPQ